MRTGRIFNLKKKKGLFNNNNFEYFFLLCKMYEVKLKLCINISDSIEWLFILEHVAVCEE